MGVSGSGKTTVGQALSEALGWAFLDADTLHPQANVDKMASGRPLTDEDRWPWLQTVRRWIDDQPESCVVACSALKRSYRDVLRRSGLVFVHLEVPPEELDRRLRSRVGHYMPPELLATQLATLEAPDPDEQVLTVPPGPVQAQVNWIVARL
jgi:gluconokinase